jgi:hypothetical protein
MKHTKQQQQQQPPQEEEEEEEVVVEEEIYRYDWALPTNGCQFLHIT